MLILVTLFHNLAHGFSDNYNALLKQHVDVDGYVNYVALKQDQKRSKIPLELEQATVPTEKNAQLAFWINAYNALTLEIIAQAYPLKSIMDLEGGKVWSTRQFNIGGQMRTLDEIEHQILRPLNDSRIHAAINCASKGCPPLWNQAFTAEQIHTELDQAMVRWVGTNAVKLDDGQISVSNIFFWFKGDFKAPSATVYPKYPKEHWGILHTLEHYSQQEPVLAAIQRGLPLKTLPYDWSLNEH
ncbi:MAG: DUF547 domain-containing protein [Myxococcota bacterium]|nr:DUF547 domain-containing protein [Myxococcota bacterium]